MFVNAKLLNFGKNKELMSMKSTRTADVSKKEENIDTLIEYVDKKA